MYFRALVAVGVTVALSFLLAWTKHRRYEVLHMFAVLVAVLGAVALSIWCGAVE